MGLGALHRGGFTRAQLAIGFQQALFHIGGGVLFQGGQDLFILAEELADLHVGAKPQRTDEHGHRQLAVFINAHIEHVVRVGLVFQPGAAVRVHGGGVELFAGLVVALAKVNARAAHQLAHDHPLGAVVHKSARVGHQGEISHKDFLLLHLAGLLVQQTRGHPQGRGIGGVALFALLDGVLGLAQAVVDEFQRQVPGEVLDGGHIAEHLFQALIQKPLVRVLLHLNEVRHVDDLIDAGKALALGGAKGYGLDLHHKKRPLLSCFLHFFGYNAQMRPFAFFVFV